ncbi:sensor histidine kinase [Treponema denticola]|uniref:Sensor histidine kinase n=1 Tax=Treponema denticola TaxID=158 RepID=A0A9Q9BPM4_TREDN|nr:sensor histidine kinase [Treponema denticola]UTC89901.1 sensor histidine kinase [Treponema denticola]UTD00748.1 sensor histidine kinase [Treponema denticola]
MKKRNCLVLTQYREGDEYNDFIGKFYHFPSNNKKNYLSSFQNLPIEFIYYEPYKKGEGVFYGYGKIHKPSFDDKRDKDFSFIEISEYKSFAKPVSYKNALGEVIEQKYNPETYNSNNAVRKISPEFLDNVCMDGQLLVNFSADAHLIKVLGEQLIGSEKVGILELVKNSIDANASYCKIRFEKIPNLKPMDSTEYKYNDFEGPVIVIEDDGDGMDKDIIENGWLRPASTIKTEVKEKLRKEREKAEKSGKLASYNTIVEQIKKENGGRIPLGEKGVGRFATHRLGRKLLIETKPKNIDFENILSIDWDDFDSKDGIPKDLNRIPVKLTRRHISQESDKVKSWTKIIIFGGKEGFELTEDKIRDINKSVLRLNTPNPNPEKMKPPFYASVECPQINDLDQEEVYKKFDPIFSLDIFVNKNGIADNYTLKFNPPTGIPLSKEKWSDENYDLKVPAHDYWMTKENIFRTPKCGAFYMHLDVWYREKPWIDGIDAKEMKDYLAEYGGISIYRDNVIIFPAESGTKNDWLNLSQRQIKQAFRISYYHMIGNIEIEQSENFELIDKTNREGMLENTAYLDLSKLIETVIQNIVEIRYISVRNTYNELTKGLIRDPQKLKTVTADSAELIKSIHDNYEILNDPWSILERFGNTVAERKEGLVNLESSIKNLKKSIEVIENIQEKITEQAGFGIAVAVSLHELTKIASNFYNGISYLINTGNADKMKLETLKDASNSLKSELKRLSPLRTIRNENRREFYLSQSIKYALEIYAAALKKAEVQVIVDYSQDFQVYARYSTFNQIMINLIDNSIYWMMSKDIKMRKIKIQLNKKYRTLIFADSGIGIDDSIRPYLFEPGYSLKIPPSGLGLYICKSYMAAMNGKIYETGTRERIPDMQGAQITIDFERVPETKENAK